MREAPASSVEEEGMPVRRSASWPASTRARRGTSKPPGRMPAAEGGFVEFTPLEAGHYSFVNHALSLAEKGQVGVFEVSD